MADQAMYHQGNQSVFVGGRLWTLPPPCKHKVENSEQSNEVLHLYRWSTHTHVGDFPRIQGKFHYIRMKITVKSPCFFWKILVNQVISASDLLNGETSVEDYEADSVPGYKGEVSLQDVGWMMLHFFLSNCSIHFGVAQKCTVILRNLREQLFEIDVPFASMGLSVFGAKKMWKLWVPWLHFGS